MHGMYGEVTDQWLGFLVKEKCDKFVSLISRNFFDQFLISLNRRLRELDLTARFSGKKTRLQYSGNIRISFR